MLAAGGILASGLFRTQSWPSSFDTRPTQESRRGHKGAPGTDCSIKHRGGEGRQIPTHRRGALPGFGLPPHPPFLGHAPLKTTCPWHRLRWPGREMGRGAGDLPPRAHGQATGSPARVRLHGLSPAQKKRVQCKSAVEIFLKQSKSSKQIQNSLFWVHVNMYVLLNLRLNPYHLCTFVHSIIV